MSNDAKPQSDPDAPPPGLAPADLSASDTPAVPAEPQRHEYPPGWNPPPPRGPINLWPERVWPAPNKAAAPSAVLAAAVGAGLVAALALRLDVPGLGWLLTGLAMLAAAIGTRKRRPGVTQTVAAVATVALLGVGTLRAAGWLFTLCVLAAIWTGTIALVGGRSWRALLLGMFAMPMGQPRAWAWSARGLAKLGSSRGAMVARVILVVGVSSLLLLVFGSLFYGADAVFADIVDAALPDFAVANLFGNAILLVIITGLTLTAACLAHLPPTFDALAVKERKPVRRWEWAVPLAVLNALFATFVVIQVLYVFGGKHTPPPGRGHREDYAAYAKAGFWALLVVAILTFIVLAIANAKASRETTVDRALLRGLLGGLSVFSLVIVAAAIKRLTGFEADWGFTEQRVFAHAVELWFGVVFVFVLFAGVRLRGAWLPRAILGTAVLTLLGLAALNPDAYIAKKNVDRFNTSKMIDVFYLGHLSPDAVPELAKLQEPQRSCALRLIDVWGDHDFNTEHWYTYNVGRAKALESLAMIKIDKTPQCPYDGGVVRR